MRTGKTGQILKRRFHLPGTTPVISCYEAGRDGFWLHRFLASKKIGNLEHGEMPPGAETIDKVKLRVASGKKTAC